MNALVARIAAGVTVLAGAGVLFGPSTTAIAGGILLGFLLPGLALTEALFRGRTLTAVERTMLAPALSLAVLVIAGLVIYAAGYALDRVAWTSATVAVTLVSLVVPGVPIRTKAERMAVAAAASNDQTEMIPIIRDDTLPPPLVRPTPPKQRPPFKRIGRQLIPMVLVLAMLGFAGWYSFDSSREAYDVTVTALSAVPHGTPDAAGQRVYEVSATGLVAANGPYSVVVTGETGTALIRRSVAVPSNGEWSADLTVGPDRTTISLYRATDTTTPYRTLYIAAEEEQ
jgi:hypothetical protein